MVYQEALKIDVENIDKNIFYNMETNISSYGCHIFRRNKHISTTFLDLCKKIKSTSVSTIWCQNGLENGYGTRVICAGGHDPSKVFGS